MKSNLLELSRIGSNAVSARMANGRWQMANPETRLGVIRGEVGGRLALAPAGMMRPEVNAKPQRGRGAKLKGKFKCRRTTRRLVNERGFLSTGEGAGRHTRGRVCSPKPTESFRPGERESAFVRLRRDRCGIPPRP